MKCGKCGWENAEGAGFCNTCGAPMAVIPQSPPRPMQGYQQQTTYDPRPYQPKKGMSRGKKIGMIAGIVIVVVVVSLVGLSLLLSAYAASTAVDITAVDVSIQYNGATSGYFGPSTQALSGTNTTTGQTISDTMTITSSALLFDHSINSITTSTPGFTISSISPALPLTFSPGSTATITLLIQTPNAHYDGVLSLTVTTT